MSDHDDFDPLGFPLGYIGRITEALEAIAEKLPTKRELAAMLSFANRDRLDPVGEARSVDKLLAELAKEKPDA
jgi:hypothetical protein